MQKITPCLCLDDKVEAAVDLYMQAFRDTSLVGAVRYEGKVLTMLFKIGPVEMLALDAGPTYKPSPAISFIVDCESEEEIEALFNRLGKDGQIMMPLDHYDFVEAKTGAKKFGWVADRFGVSWQLLMNGKPQAIIPCLMFVQEQSGRALEAIHFYQSRFAENTVNKETGAFQLAGQNFFAFDSPEVHQFGFTPGISFMVNCKNQSEIDAMWDSLKAEGGEEVFCGWLTDKFGVSWQVVPEMLSRKMVAATPEQIDKGMAAVKKMIKLDEAVLDAAYF